MGLFRSGAEKELDAIIQRIEMNMSNNYKDNAQDGLKELEARFEELKQSGKLKDKVARRYESLIGDYKCRLKGYSHKDQKPYWT